MAIATVTLAEVSRHAAAGNMADLKETLSFSPAPRHAAHDPGDALLIALARPIIGPLPVRPLRPDRHGADRPRPLGLCRRARRLLRRAGDGACLLFARDGAAPVMISMSTIGATVLLYFPLMRLFQHMDSRKLAV